MSRVKTAVEHEVTRHLVKYRQEEMEKNGWGSTKAQGPEGWVPAWGSHAPLLLDPCPIQLLITGKGTTSNQGANEKLLQPPPQCGPWVPTHPMRPGPPLVAAGKKLPLFLPFYILPCLLLADSHKKPTGKVQVTVAHHPAGSRMPEDGRGAQTGQLSKLEFAENLLRVSPGSKGHTGFKSFKPPRSPMSRMLLLFPETRRLSLKPTDLPILVVAERRQQNHTPSEWSPLPASCL